MEIQDQPTKCPYCGNGNVYFCCNWDAISVEDGGNNAILDEWQCQNCEGRSFWV